MHKIKKNILENGKKYRQLNEKEGTGIQLISSVPTT